MRAILLLEDGFALQGNGFAARGETIGEVVFNTSMAGYQEILTDPSYKGQIVCMTYPLIGNYGINPQDVESKRVQVEGFIVKEKSRLFSNWRARQSLDGYLKQNRIVGIEGIDTRALTRRLRLYGAMKGIISSVDFDVKSLKKKLAAFPSIVGRDLVKQVTCKRIYKWKPRFEGREPKHKGRIVVIDCGVKQSILDNLAGLVKEVIVVPASSSLRRILNLKPEGILFSNGPGDPAAVEYVIDTAKELVKLKIPIMGICLGHQILGLALGGKTYKLKFGHHGGNHPVKDLNTGGIDITTQNHNFCVDIDSIPDKDIEPTHVNLYDKTNEGLRHKRLPLFSVQFHPEAAPGPYDARYLFGRFIKMMKK
jgi:carbamoyl-phosphate synthase small subunit